VSVKPLLLDPATTGCLEAIVGLQKLIKTCLPKRVITAVEEYCAQTKTNCRINAIDEADVLG